MPLGAKLDDSSVAYASALAIANKQTEENKIAEDIAKAKAALDSAMKTGDEGIDSPEDGEAIANVDPNTLVDTMVGNTTVSKGEEYGDDCLGFSPEEIEAAVQEEKKMQARDEEITKVQSARNDLEAFIYGMRAAPRCKHGELIKADELKTLLDDCENWLWDNEIISLSELEGKFKSIREEAAVLCQAYDEANEKDKLALEATLKEESIKAEAERAAEGEDEDHDNRKLKKEDRMRMVVKNKEEGTELFKGGNFRPAAARYHKALTHASKFFDLSPDDENEVKAVKLSLYLNLAQCYIKLENFDNVIRNCDEALSIEPNNAKALFRRATAYETKKDWDRALEDLKKAAVSNPEDKAIPKAEERIKKMA